MYQGRNELVSLMECITDISVYYVHILYVPIKMLPTAPFYIFHSFPWFFYIPFHSGVFLCEHKKEHSHVKNSSSRYIIVMS